jgi:hypothetical protein
MLKDSALLTTKFTKLTTSHELTITKSSKTNKNKL